MANKPLKTITFPGLTDTYTLLQKSEVVRYDAAQGLTDAQKTQARANTGAASEDLLSQLIDLEPIQTRTYYHMIPGSCHVAGTSIYSPDATQKIALIQQIIPRVGGEKYYYDDSTYELAFVPLTDAGVSKGYYGWYRSSPWTDPITTTGSYLTFLIRRQDGGNFTAADDLNGLIWKVPDVATNPIVAQRELAEANAAGYTDAAVKAAVDSIGRSVPAGYVRYEFPADFTWTDNPVAGKVYTDGKGRFFVDYDVMSHMSTTGLDVYVSAAGSDSNDGLSASTPKKTLSAAIAISGARRVHIAGGHYPMQNLTISADIDLIGDPDDRPVFTGQSNTSEWTATATTGVYTTAHKNHAVFYDLTTKADGFYRAYVEAESVSAVEATAGTYYDDGTTATLHTYGSSTTPYDDVCYTAGFYAMQLTTSGHQVLVANLCFTCGGSYSGFGLLELVGDETNRGTYLVYNCDGSYSIPATESGSSAFVPHNADVVIQNCTAYHSGNDGFSYATGCKVVEINCASAFNGSGSITSSNGSTGHGGSIIRINGAYHDTYGPVVHDVGATESVNLGLSAWHSTCEGKPNFCASGGAVKMWLDSCVGYSSDAGIDVGKPGEPAASAVIYKRNCTSDVEDGMYGGQIVRY